MSLCVRVPHVFESMFLQFRFSETDMGVRQNSAASKASSRPFDSAQVSEAAECLQERYYAWGRDGTTPHLYEIEAPDAASNSPNAAEAEAPDAGEASALDADAAEAEAPDAGEPIATDAAEAKASMPSRHYKRPAAAQEQLEDTPMKRRADI